MTTTLYTGNTFEAYRVLVDQIPGEWIELKFGEAKSLVSAIAQDGNVARNALTDLIDFLSILEFPEDGAILKFGFDENACSSGIMSPVIRKHEETYVVQIVDSMFRLRPIMEQKLFKVTPDVAKVGEGETAYKAAIFNFEFIDQNDTDKESEFGAVARKFALRVDAAEINGVKQYEELASTFSPNPGLALPYVAEFKVPGSYNKQPKDLPPGDYKVVSYTTEVREKSDKSSKWSVYVLTLEDGRKIDAPASLRIMSPLGDALSSSVYSRAIAQKGCFWMRITDIEIIYKKDGSVSKTKVNGSLFKDIPPPAAPPKAIKSASPANYLPSVTVNAIAQAVNEQHVEDAPMPAF